VALRDIDRDFTEDELNTFEGWLRYQTFDIASASPQDVAIFRRLFDDTMQQRARRQPMGRMKFKPMKAGEYHYAVAVRDSEALWLVLRIRRSPEPAVFVMHPTGEGERGVHASYHADGTIQAQLTEQPFSARPPLPAGSHVPPPGTASTCP